MLEQTMLLSNKPEPKPVQKSALRLLRLVLRNFKGVREFMLDLPAGENVSVFGDNATGKTTLFDAYYWLLFGKDSQNRSDFEVKTLDENNQPIHGLEHEVEALFALGRKQFTLRKVYKEQWTKKRGAAEKQFSGHVTEHFFDGVPVTKREYEARIAEIVDDKTFRLLSDPAYLNEVLTWQERRAILLDVCGDISDADVIAADANLKDLTDILGGRSLDDHKAMLKSRRAKINDELQKIPVRINEATRALPDVSGVKPDALKDDVAKAQAARQAILEQIALAESGGAIAEKQNELAQIKAQLLDMETAARRKSEDALKDKREQLNRARIAVDAAETQIYSLKEHITEHEGRASRIADQMQQLRADWMAVDAEELEYSAQTVCPACGQDLLEDQVEAARQKALADFNQTKATKLEAITAEGMALKLRKERAEAAAADACARLAEAERRLSDAKRDVVGLETALNEARSQQADASQTPEYGALAMRRDVLATEIASLKAGAQASTDALKAELATIEQALQALNRTDLQVHQHTQGQKRIAELKAQEKTLTAEFEQIERELYLCDEFTRSKVRLLEDSINAKFRYARFKLFDQQVNGAISDTCQTLYGGIPYGSNLNRGARMNVGLDVINALSEHYRFAVPVWVDNAEAVTQLLPMSTQLIRLVVSKPDKTLRIVKEAY